MKYIIHSCNSRLWYVNKYLIPSMVEQGINGKDIILWNDDKEIGNLASWLSCCEWVKDNLDLNEGAWHLQDDVVICREFKSKTKDAYNNFDVVCGFCTPAFAKKGRWHTGKVGVENMWMSFPCIYIPNKYLKEFLFWFDNYIIKDGNFKEERLTEQMDDFFFVKFIRTQHWNISSYNLKPNLVDHIDYLLGGSTLGRKKVHRAIYFEDKDLVDKLKEDLDRRC